MYQLPAVDLHTKKGVRRRQATTAATCLRIVHKRGAATAPLDSPDSHIPLNCWSSKAQPHSRDDPRQENIAHHLPPREQGIPDELAGPNSHVGRHGAASSAARCKAR